MSIIYQGLNTIVDEVVLPKLQLFHTNQNGGKGLEGEVRDWRGRQGIGGGGKELEGEVRDWRGK